MSDTWRIERRTYDPDLEAWGNWVAIETEIEIDAVDGEYTYEDETLVADGIYQYRVKHVGDDSDWMESNEITYIAPLVLAFDTLRKVTKLIEARAQLARFVMRIADYTAQNVRTLKSIAFTIGQTARKFILSIYIVNQTTRVVGRLAISQGQIKRKVVVLLTELRMQTKRKVILLVSSVWQLRRNVSVLIIFAGQTRRRITQYISSKWQAVRYVISITLLDKFELQPMPLDYALREV